MLRRILSFVALLLVLVLIPACGGEGKSSDKGKSPIPDTAPPNPSPGGKRG
jgi:hypothetical protein